MPYEVASTSIETAIRALLVADATLVGRIASKPSARGGGPAIYNDGDVPSGATFPYLTIGGWTQEPFHSMSPDGSPGESAYGWNCTLQIKALGQLNGGKNEATLKNVISAVLGILPDGQRLTVSGYGSAFMAEARLPGTFYEQLAGVVTIHVPAIFRVYVNDV